MSVETPPFAIQGTGLSYGAEQLRRAMFAWAARKQAGSPGQPAGGLIAPSDLQLSAPSSGMTVNVSAGECLIPGTAGGAQGAYYGFASSTTNLTIATADPSNPRVDTVVATVADTNYTAPSDLSGNQWALVVLTGTPTAGATLANRAGAAAVPLSSLVLGYVLVPAASSNVVQANISNAAVPVALENVAQFLQTVAGNSAGFKLQMGRTGVTLNAAGTDTLIALNTPWSKAHIVFVAQAFFAPAAVYSDIYDLGHGRVQPVSGSGGSATINWLSIGV